MKKDALKGLGDDVAKLCGSENLLQRQMVLLAMSQNALVGESGLSRFWGNGDELPFGMQFVLKRDEKTGDVLLSRQTPPNVGFGYSMTLRIRPDGSQTVAYLEASHAGHVSGLLDEKGFPLRMDSDITSGKPSTKEEVAKAKTYVAGWQKLLTQIKNLRDNYSNAFSKNLACALSKFDSSENRQFLVQFAKHLEKPGVDAQYVRSQISNRFNLVASRMEESEYDAFNGFLSAVMNVKPQKFIYEYYDTAELDVLVDKKGLQVDIGRLVDQDAFPADLYALQSVIKDIGLEIHRKRLEADRIEPQDASQQQVQSQPAVEEQEQPKKAEPSDKDEEIIEDDPVEIVRDKGIRNSEINLNRSDIIRENIDFGLEDDEVIFRE